MSDQKKLTILSIPFEASTSFLKGTKEGPEAILNALHAKKNLSLKTTETCDSDETDPKAMESSTFNAAVETLETGGFPLGLGGEHTVSIGLVRAAKAHTKIGIVQLDAHADLRDEYEGNPLSHACAMRRVVETETPLLGIGVRAMCEEEAMYVASRDDVNLVDGRLAVFSTDWYHQIMNLPPDIYLSIDMDVFDPTDVPAVGTPEPGGMSYDAVHQFLKHLFKNKNVLAADIVELRPCEGDESSVRIAADLVRLIAELL